MPYIRLGEASQELGVSNQTLRKWVDDGKIPSKLSPGGQRMVDLDSYLNGKEISDDLENPKLKIFYCRVSSRKQQDDLERQVSLAKSLYPDHQIISDIGSGINWKRKGLLSIIEKVTNHEIDEVVIFHKDRLARFGYELIDQIFKMNNVTLKVHDGSEGSIYKSPEEELAEDLMAVATVFSCRQMGKRRYQKKLKLVPTQND